MDGHATPIANITQHCLNSLELTSVTNDVAIGLPLTVPLFITLMAKVVLIKEASMLLFSITYKQRVVTGSERVSVKTTGWAF